MSNLTLGVISGGLVFIVGLISAVKYLQGVLKEYLTALLKDEFSGINQKLDSMDGKLDKVDLEACKNFLVRFLADAERGDKITEIEKQRFWEEYEHYTGMGGNSYIHEWVERLKKEGKL